MAVAQVLCKSAMDQSLCPRRWWRSAGLLRWTRRPAARTTSRRVARRSGSRPLAGHSIDEFARCYLQARLSTLTVLSPPCAIAASNAAVELTLFTLFSRVQWKGTLVCVRARTCCCCVRACLLDQAITSPRP